MGITFTGGVKSPQGSKFGLAPFDKNNPPVSSPIIPTLDYIYVSSTGNDANDGLTTNTPILTFAHATTLVADNTGGISLMDNIVLPSSRAITKNITIVSTTTQSTLSGAGILYPQTATVKFINVNLSNAQIDINTWATPTTVSYSFCDFNLIGISGSGSPAYGFGASGGPGSNAIIDFDNCTFTTPASKIFGSFVDGAAISPTANIASTCNITSADTSIWAFTGKAPWVINDTV